MESKLTCYLIISFLLIQSPLLFGQDDFKFGKITDAELNMKIYDKDSSANALILFDRGNSFIEIRFEGVRVIHERHIRIKILNKGGYSSADVKIPLYINEEIRDLEGYTYTLENGEIKKYKLEKDAIFDEKFNKNITLKKFSMPNVVEGAVIEYKYKFSTPYLSDFVNWKFQSRIPCLHSEYKASFYGYYSYKILFRGFGTFTVNTSKNEMQSFYLNPGNGLKAIEMNTAIGGNLIEVNTNVYHWIANNISALKEEKYMPNPNDYIFSVSFKLESVKNADDQIPRNILATWEEINTKLLEHEDFGLQLKDLDFLKETAQNIIGSETNPEKKIILIYDYVKNNFKWNGIDGIYLDQQIRKVFDAKTGDGIGINFILIGLLTHAGFDCNPVILSTKDNGSVIPLYPDIRQMNYVIAHVNLYEKGYMLLDATEPLRTANLLPLRCPNDKGWLVSSKSNAGWVSLLITSKNQHTSNVVLKFNESGKLAGNIQTSDSDYNALAIRNFVAFSDQKEYLKTNLLNDNLIEELVNHKFENLNGDLYKPVKCSIEVKTNISLEDIVYINPIFTDLIDENPFKLEERKFPIDFGYPSDNNYFLTIQMPDGYKVEEMPKSAVVTLPNNGGSFNYTVGAAGNMIQLKIKVSIKKDIFQPEEYKYLKEFYAQMIAKQAEQIVLKKI